MSQQFSAKVKNVLSGDTLVLVPIKTAQFPVPERTLTLQYVRGESFEAKEFLRQLVIGKEIKFRVLFKMPTSGKEFGDVSAPIFSSLIEYLLERGWVKMKDNVRADSEQEEELILRLRAAEEAAKKKQVGVWSPKFVEPEIVPLSAEVITQSTKTPFTTVIERVISGDRVVGRVIVAKNKHVLLPLILAGYKAPRTDDPDAEQAKIGQLAKKFVEDALLMSKATVKVTIIGENQGGLPLVLVEHPSGNNVHEKVLENGLGEVLDWQSSLIGSETMGKLRRAEQTARALGKGLFASAAGVKVPSSVPSSGSLLAKNLKPGATIEHVTVAKVVNADTLNVRLPSGEELTVQLASLRAPRPNDTTVTSNPQHQQALVQMARDFTRTHAIGKSAQMYIDGHRAANKDLGLDARWLVSLKIGGKDLSEQLVAHGFATVIKHNKQTAHERSLNWDKLVELEEQQKREAKRGVYYSGDISKILTIGTRVVNASESVTKAKTFFSGFNKKGRISGYYVEFVLAVNRVKLYNPKEGTKLTLILGGLSNDRNSDAGDAGLAFMNRKFLQRNVEFEVYDTDKIGGFIGNLFANSQTLKPVQVELLAAGLTAVHNLAVSSNPFEKDFFNAENVAKSSKQGIWENYDEAQVQRERELANSKMAALSLEAAQPKFFDIEVVDVGKNLVLSFHHIDAKTSAEFAQFKKDFNDFHSQHVSASTTSVDLPTALGKGPKKNDVVSAKFSENGKFYRARVINFDRATGKYDVKHVDFGNVDQVPLSALRALPRKFALDVIKPFAHSCRLQNIELPPNQPKDYLTEALYVLEDLTFDKKLVLSGLPSAADGVEYDGVLYDSEQSLTDADYTINKQLVLEGWGMVESKCASHLKEYVDNLVKAEKKAKSDRVGCWEFGDIRVEEDY
ncbi:nuclease domain-containing protein 1 [Metschnikowia aff. pulcherrima]|uniref:Nuclease domain-containing protein 1 n=1 Tax=Metschnikowia aff. pulcherrima TaxID=2163413 RepID=A0A4P6XQR4_9ASCO|nr:nuclease domain-containing protein 1 [Metschnikowia aff. pulcherrima]